MVPIQLLTLGKSLALAELGVLHYQMEKEMPVLQLMERVLWAHGWGQAEALFLSANLGQGLDSYSYRNC